MSRLGSVKPKEFIRKLLRAGFFEDHQTGSHVILRHPSGARLVVPYHAREMKRGLLMALLKQAGLSVEDFISL
jgi:predicted RNA binding protein YcfA (HicA-like mRNA interferase family)